MGVFLSGLYLELPLLPMVELVKYYCYRCHGGYFMHRAPAPPLR